MPNLQACKTAKCSTDQIAARDLNFRLFSCRLALLPPQLASRYTCMNIAVVSAPPRSTNPAVEKAGGVRLGAPRSMFQGTGPLAKKLKSVHGGRLKKRASLLLHLEERSACRKKRSRAEKGDRATVRWSNDRGFGPSFGWIMDGRDREVTGNLSKKNICM